MSNFLLYLLEVAACQALFCLLYLIVFRNLSFFQLNRFYLLSATLLSFVIPVISIPFWSAAEYDPTLNLLRNLQNLGTNIESEATIRKEAFPATGWLITLLLIYFIGFLLHLFQLSIGIVKILKLIKHDKTHVYDGIKTIHITKGPAFFAFLNYIFINTNRLHLSIDEFQQVINHEKSHILQKHTLDNLFMELVITICWFNPFVRIMKRELNNVHEFYADQQATGSKHDVANYSSLILRLSSDKNNNRPFLGHQFSMINIKQRIIMLNKQKNPKRIAIKYVAIVPCLSLLLVMFSFTKKAPLHTLEVSGNAISQSIGNITWKGNSLYSDSYLTEFLGLEAGEKFNEEEINAILNYKADGSDLASLYMDQGYLFFVVELQKKK